MSHWLDGLGGLDVICSQFLISSWAVTAAALVGSVVYLLRHHRRAHPWLRWSGWSAVTAAAAVFAVAASVNAHYAYLPTLGDVAQSATSDRQWVTASRLPDLPRPTAGRARTAGLTVRFPTPADPADGMPASTTVIYLPPQYFTDPTTRFPVVYLFHGSPGQPSDWFHGGRAAHFGRLVAAEGFPAILVAPRMSRSWTDDPECVDGASEKVETHLFTRVIPTIDGTLRTRDDRSDRVFAGMSAGGYCALNLALRHPDAVGTVIDLSGDTAPTHTGGAISLFGRRNPRAAGLVAANTPADYLHTRPPRPRLQRIWLDSGTDDRAITLQMRLLARQLAPVTDDLVVRTRPGGHTYRVWTAALHDALPWALGAPPLPGPRTWSLTADTGTATGAGS